MLRISNIYFKIGVWTAVKTRITMCGLLNHVGLLVITTISDQHAAPSSE
jgi:hypothetical protein